mgnify:FL=1
MAYTQVGKGRNHARIGGDGFVQELLCFCNMFECVMANMPSSPQYTIPGVEIVPIFIVSAGDLGRYARKSLDRTIQPGELLDT